MKDIIKKFGKVRRVEPVGHKAYDLVSPVMIGDVLDYLIVDGTDSAFNINELVRKWSKACSVDKSLQQIEKENTKQAQELFNFLTEIL